MESARDESDPRSTAHNELEAILRDAHAVRRRTPEEDSPDERPLEPRPRLSVVERAQATPTRRSVPSGENVRFDRFDVRVDDPGEMKIKAFRFSGRLTLALLLGFLTVYLWVTSPHGMTFLRTAPLPASYSEASARWAMVLTAERIDRFHADHMRLPNDLEELGPSTSELIGYQRLSETEYRLQAPGQYSPLTLNPTTDRETFLSNGLDILRVGPDNAP